MRTSSLLRMRATQPLGFGFSPIAAMRQSFRKRMPQDMPPEGGYDPVQYKRNLPARGFKTTYYLAAVAAIMTYGWYKYGKGVLEWNELGREKMWSRIHLIPLLQAEEDRDQVRRWYAGQEREKDLLGSSGKIYHSDRFVRPTYQAGPPPED